MKIKVTNPEISCFNSEFKVEKMNYDMVMIIKDGSKIALSTKDIEFIPETPNEDILVAYRDIIKIKLNKGVTAGIYVALINCIKENNGEEIKKIDVLKDQYRVIRKGLWEKNLFLVINESIPLDIHVTGKNHERQYDIWITNMELFNFIDECTFEVDQLQKEIMEKKKLIKRYKKVLKKVGNQNENGMEYVEHQLTSGM